VDIKQQPSSLVILTGQRGSGKTALCSLLVDKGRKAGWQVKGLMTPAVFEAEQKTAIDALDLHSRQRRLLARVRQDGDTGIQTMSWTFDPQALEWGSRVLRESVPCDLLVVDELGPLELLRSQGWTAGLDVLDNGEYKLGVVVIRSELLEIARRRWPHASEIIVVSPEGALNLVNQICCEYGMI
jgi:nucleoside-triphosphatase